MCGRFVLYETFEQLTAYFDADVTFDETDLDASYNIAPSENILIVVNDGNRNRMGFVKWGFIPEWARDDRMGAKLMNARAETVDDKPTFRDSFKKRRCVIPMNGYYEWTTIDDTRAPMFIHRPQNELLCAAGIWSTWRNEAGDKIHTCAILTTAANETLSTIHHRMPAFLTKEQMHTWLKKDADVDTLKSFLLPSDPSLRFHEVDKRVNAVKFNEKNAILPI